MPSSLYLLLGSYQRGDVETVRCQMVEHGIMINAIWYTAHKHCPADCHRYPLASASPKESRSGELGAALCVNRDWLVYEVLLVPIVRKGEISHCVRVFQRAQDDKFIHWTVGPEWHSPDISGGAIHPLDHGHYRLATILAMSSATYRPALAAADRMHQGSPWTDLGRCGARIEVSV